MSSYRRTATNNAGDSTLYGANDFHVVIDLLNGSVSNSPPVKFKNTTNKVKFFDNVLQFRNQADSFDLTIRGPSGLGANRDLTLPAVAVNDTIAALLLSQEFFNKTIKLSNNTLTETSAAAGDIIVHDGTSYVRLPAGTTSQFLRGDGTWQLPPGAAGGEANTSSNVGSGQGWAKAKVGVDLPFKSFIVGSNKLTLTSNTNDLTVDVAEANLTLDNLGGTLSISKGGTGQTSKTNAFDALSPLTTQGDLMYHNGSDNVRLAKGTGLQYLRMNIGATAPEWATLSAGGANSGNIIGDYVSTGYMYAWLYPSSHLQIVNANGFLGGEDLTSGVKNDVTTQSTTVGYDATATRGHFFLLNGVDGGNTGWMRIGITSLPFQRRYSPFADFWLRFRQAPTDARFACFFTGDTSPADTSDTPLNGESGFGLMKLLASTGVVPIYNDGDATQDTGTSLFTVSTNMVHVRIEFDEANTRGIITINGSATNYSYGSIDPPANTTPLYFWINIDESGGSTDQLVEVYRPTFGIKIP